MINLKKIAMLALSTVGDFDFDSTVGIYTVI